MNCFNLNIITLPFTVKFDTFVPICSVCMCKCACAVHVLVCELSIWTEKL